MEDLYRKYEESIIELIPARKKRRQRVVETF